MKITFTLHHQIDPTHHIFITGSPSPLGQWQLNLAVKMNQDSSDVHHLSCEIDDPEIEYQYIVTGSKDAAGITKETIESESAVFSIDSCGGKKKVEREDRFVKKGEKKPEKPKVRVGFDGGCELQVRF